MNDSALILRLLLGMALATMLVGADSPETACIPQHGDSVDLPAGRELREQWLPGAQSLAPGLTTISLRLAPTVQLGIVFQSRSASAPPLPVPQLVENLHARAAINGGYFATTFRPSGLVRIDGAECAPFSAAALLSGCLVIDAHGQAALVPARDALVATAPQVVQSGPFLIDPGGTVGIRSHPGLPRAARSVIACSAQGRMSLIATSPVTLHDLSVALHDHPEAFGLSDVDRCLNLDGGPSTVLVIRGDPFAPATMPEVLLPVVLIVQPMPGRSRP